MSGQLRLALPLFSGSTLNPIERRTDSWTDSWTSGGKSQVLTSQSQLSVLCAFSPKAKKPLSVFHFITNIRTFIHSFEHPEKGKEKKTTTYQLNVLTDVKNEVGDFSRRLTKCPIRTKRGSYITRIAALHSSFLHADLIQNNDTKTHF